MNCVTVTLNASIDTTYLLPTLYAGGVNRVGEKLAVPGGKGNNVARVLAMFGHSVTATGFTAGRAGQYIDEALQEFGIETAFVSVPGESRTSLAIIEQVTGTVTEIREAGAEVTPEDGQRFLESLKELVQDAQAVVLSGSLPPGLPDDFYAQVIRLLGDSRAIVALDSSGMPFEVALREQPGLIKPNASEMAALLGKECSDAEMANAGQQLIGPVLADDAVILLSLGERGAVLITGKEQVFAQAPAIDVKSPVGSGDAMVAGYLDARFQGEGVADTLRHAVAAGSAAVLHLTPGTVDLADVMKLKGLVRVWQR